MHDPRRMRRRQRIGDLHSKAQRLLHTDSARLNQVRQRLAGHILHHHVLVIGVGEDVVNRNDVGMVQAAGRLGLLDETPAPLRVPHRVDRQSLDRDSSVQTWIPGLEDVTHAARAQFFGDLVMRDCPPDHT